MAVTICAAVALAACSAETARQAYQDTSDWLNEVPEPPPDQAWRLSKKIDPEDLPYPNLGDVPDRPQDVPTAEETARQIHLIEAAGQPGPAPADNGPPTQATGPDPRTLGAPPPPRIEPLIIPPPPS